MVDVGSRRCLLGIRRSIASPPARSSIPENPGSPTGVFFFLTWLSVGDRQPAAHCQGAALDYGVASEARAIGSKYLTFPGGVWRAIPFRLVR